MSHPGNESKRSRFLRKIKGTKKSLSSSPAVSIDRTDENVTLNTQKSSDRSQNPEIIQPVGVSRDITTKSRSNSPNPPNAPPDKVVFSGVGNIPSSKDLDDRQAQQTTPRNALTTGAPDPVPVINNSPAVPTKQATLKSKRQYLDLWQKAIDSIPEPERSAFVSAGDNRTALESFTADVKVARDVCREKQWQFNWNGKKIVLRDVADKVLVWVSKFKEIGDIVVQIDPVHAAAPWAVFRFLLQVVLKDPENMGYIVLGIERISSTLARCAIYEGLYLPASGNRSNAATTLEESILRLYTAIIRFLLEAKAYVIQSTAARSLGGLFSPERISSLLKDLDMQEAEVIKNLQSCQAETSVTMSKELKGLLKSLEEPIIRIDTTLAVIKDDLEASKRRKILTWISTIEYGRHHNRSKSGIAEGTCEWLLKNQKFLDWRKDSSSGIMWLNGEPGTGKTKLTSRVIQHLLDDRARRGSHEALAYFYCDRGDPETREPEKILRALVKQLTFVPPELSHLHPAVVKEYCEREKTGFSSGGLEVDDSVAVMTTLADMYPLTNIVLDALDEIEQSSRQVLIRSLKQISQNSKSLVKVFVSSRKEKDIIFHFKHVSNHYITPSDNAMDIDTFIDKAVDTCVENGDLSLETSAKTTPEVIYQKIKSTLKSSAHGMFLWVDLQIRDLCNLHHEDDVEAALRRLPNGLEKTYELILSSIMKERDHSRYVAITAIQWVIGAKVPMQLNELLGAIYWSMDDNPSKERVMVSKQLLLTVCHNLITVDESKFKHSYTKQETTSNIVRFNHVSAREYLENSISMQINLAASTIREKTLRAFCRSLIQETYPCPGLKDIHHYAMVFWVEIAQDMRSEDWNADIERLFIQWVGPPNADLSSALLATVETANLIWMVKNSNFGSRWLRNIYNYVASKSNSPIFLAVTLSLPKYLQDILTANPGAIFFKNFTGRTPIETAGEAGELEVVELLLKTASRPDTIPPPTEADVATVEAYLKEHLPRAVSYAAAYGRFDTAKVILSQITEAKERTELLNKSETDEVSKFLLSNGTRPDGYTLPYAARKKFPGAVRILLEQRDEEVLSGLDIALQSGARQRGNHEIVAMLIAHGADANYGDALLAAARCGSPETLDLMLRNGATKAEEAFIQAVCSNNTENIAFLLQRGDLGAKVKNTALESAAFLGRPTGIKLLLENGADEIELALTTAIESDTRPEEVDEGIMLLIKHVKDKNATFRQLVRRGKVPLLRAMILNFGADDVDGALKVAIDEHYDEMAYYLEEEAPKDVENFKENIAKGNGEKKMSLMESIGK